MEWLFFGVLAYLSYSISSSLDKYFMKKGNNPIITNTLKMIFDGIILLFLGFLFFDLHFSKTLILMSIPLGLFYALSGIFYFASLKSEDVEIVIPYLQAFSLLLLFFFSIILFNESITYLTLIAVLLIIIGIYINLSKDGLAVPKLGKGIIIMTLSVVFSVIYSLLAKSFLFNFDPLSLAITMYFSCSVFLATYSIFNQRKNFKIVNTKIFISAIFGALGTFLLFKALSLGDGSKVFPLAGLESIFVFLIAIIFMKERFQWHRFIGIIIAVIGIYLLSI